jgi:hexosaminidase
VGYRDELEAAQARAEALERQLADKDAELREAQDELDAARAKPPRLGLMNTDEMGTVFHLGIAETQIGRTDDNDIAITDARLSRHHARITFFDGDHYIEDAESTSGVWINSRAIRTRTKLASGDIVRLGGVKLRYIGAGEDFLLEEPAPQAREPVSMRGLVIVVVIALSLLTFAQILLGCGSDPEPRGANVIPLPQQILVEAGGVELTSASRITVTAGVELVAERLADVLRPSTGYAFDVVVDAAAPGDIALVIDDTLDAIGAEGYRIAVTDVIEIRAATNAGLFYGAQTLRQLLPPAVEAATVQDADWTVPNVTVEDYPRFEWRGTMLDVARHFFGVDDVKRLIDLAAYHKLNRLHLHLTDDQGWRIHIDSWPMLTAIGGSTEVGGGPGGFYTKADYAELVDYAAARFVTIVPEIDMPGHTNAALASYPELNESGTAPPLYTDTDVGFSSLWIGGAITLQFVDDVLGEIAAMTPGGYIHIGGDEAAATSAEDYAAFIAAVRTIVEDHGKIMVGWEEISSAAIDAPFLAQHWLTDGEARDAVDAGGRLISSPAIYAYLDIMYDIQTPIGLNWVGFTDVDKAYEWDPVLSGVNESDVIGVEAPLWTETVETREHIDLLAFPRLSGHAEIAWSAADGRTWQEYRQRLAHHGERLDALGVGYYRSPVVDWFPQ